MDEESTHLDSYISRYIGIKTPREIAELAGSNANDVIRRAEEMKDSADALTIEAQIYFAMRSLNEIAADAKTDASQAVDNRDKAGLYSAAVSAITQSLKQLNVLKKENDGAVAELNRKRVQELLRLFDLVIEKGVADLAVEHNLDKTELLTVFQGHIVGAARELER